MERLQAKIADIAEGVHGLLGVCVADVASGAEVGVRIDEPLPMASVCKIPVLVAAYREHDNGRLDLSERVDFGEDRRCPGSGLLNAFEPGLRPTLHDLMLMMIAVSDNAATDVLLERLTPAGVTAHMGALGLDGIRVDRTIRQLLDDIGAALDPRLRGSRYGDWDRLKKQHPDLEAKGRDLDALRGSVNAAACERDTSTPGQMARLCRQLARHDCASHASCEAMLEILGNQQLNGRLPRDLPAMTRFPHKTGTLGSGAVVNDAGILYREDEPLAAVAVLSRDVRDPAHETNSALARIGRAAYDHYWGSP